MKGRIRLEPMTADDLGILQAWVHTPQLLTAWCGRTFEYPLTRPQLEAFLDSAGGDPPEKTAWKAVDGHNSVLGFAAVLQFDRQAGMASLGLVLVDPERRGEGLAGVMLEALLARLFGELGLHRVQLNVYDFNTAAIRCYEKAGFVREGLRRETTCVDGTWWNAWMMSILEHEWRKRRDNPAD